MNNIARVLHGMKESERDDLAIQIEALNELREPLDRVLATLHSYNSAATVSEALSELYNRIYETAADVDTYRDFITEDYAHAQKTLTELEQTDW